MTAASPLVDLSQLRARGDEIVLTAAAHGARNVRVFGSVATGEAGPVGDVDLLVEMGPGGNLLDFVGLWQELEELLGTRAAKPDLLRGRTLLPQTWPHAGLSSSCL
ncbi:MAG: nucleotidyltransferase family protein [Solirubrobacteraceae bacterium]|jgi:predicted nucleotidyltransferase